MYSQARVNQVGRDSYHNGMKRAIPIWHVRTGAELGGAAPRRFDVGGLYFLFSEPLEQLVDTLLRESAPHLKESEDIFAQTGGSHKLEFSKTPQNPEGSTIFQRVMFSKLAAPRVINDDEGTDFRGLDYSFRFTPVLAAQDMIDQQNVNRVLVVIVAAADEIILSEKGSDPLLRCRPPIQLGTNSPRNMEILE